MAKRNVIPGIVLRPEAFRLINSNLTWFATRYTIYGDRARQRLLFDDTYTGVSKESFSYSVDMTDDTVIFFTTNIQLSDGSWCGESPLTPVILRKNRVSSSGIITTPEIAVSFIDDTMVVVGSEYIRYEGSAVHTETDYIIEDDITGEVKYKRLEDRENLTKLEIKDLELDPNRLYRLQVRYKDVLGKYSNYGSCLITSDSILHDLILNDSIRLSYGSDITIDNDNGIEYVLNPDEVTMDIYRRNILLKTIKYDKGFYINSMDYSVGDVIYGIAKYINHSKKVEILILNRDIENDDIDPDFKIKGLFNNLDASDFLLTGVGTSKQMNDGFIYDLDSSNNTLVQIEYDDVLNKIVKKNPVLSLVGVSEGLPNRVVFNNPYGGLILLLSPNIEITTPAISQKVVFISKTGNTFLVDKVVIIDHNSYGATHNNSSFIDNNKLVIYNKIYYGNRNMIKIFSIDLLTKIVADDGIINMDNLYLKGYAPIKIDNEVLMFKSGVETKDLSYREEPVYNGANSPLEVMNSIIVNGWLYESRDSGLTKTNITTGERKVLYTGYVSNAYRGVAHVKSNNKLYFSPSSANNIMVVDLNNNDSVSFITSPSIPDGIVKWIGFKEYNNKLYAAPQHNANILVLDLSNNTVSTIATSGSVDSYRWHDNVLADGVIYHTPYYENRIMTLNVSTNVVSYIAVPNLSKNQQKYAFSYYDPIRRNIYFCPYHGREVMVLNIDTKNIRYIPISDYTVGVGSAIHYTIGKISDNEIYLSPFSDGCIRVLNLNTEKFTKIPTSRGIGSKYIPEQKRHIVLEYNPTDGIGYTNIYLPDTTDNSKIVKNNKNSLSIKAEIPNPITVVNAPLISRLVKLKNNKPAFIYAPSIDNNKAGVVEIDSDTYILTDKRASISSTTNHRIVYTLSDGRIITADNDKAILFY